MVIYISANSLPIKNMEKEDSIGSVYRQKLLRLPIKRLNTIQVIGGEDFQMEKEFIKREMEIFTQDILKMV